MRTPIHRILLSASLLLLAACGSAEPPTQPPAKSLTLALSGQSMTLAQSAVGTVTATIGRSNFTGDVTLSASNVPTGSTVTFSPTTVSGTTSTITVTAGASTTPGTYTITITAASAGVTSATANLALTVTASGGYSLSAAPATLSVAQGGSISSTITVARTGSFAGAVPLTVSGLPAGMTGVLTPTTVPGTSTTSALALTAGATTPVGTYTVTVRGTVTDLADQTVALTVNVTPAVVGTQITVNFCDEPPMWVGLQNDGAAWTQVTSTSTTYTFVLTGSKAAVATSSGSASTGYSTDVTYATTAEFQAMAQAQNAFCASGANLPPGTKTLTGSVANVPVTHMAFITLGNASAQVIPTTGSTFTLTEVPDGARDLFASRMLMSTFAADKMILRRGLNLANNAVIPVLDFNAAEAFTPVAGTLTVTGLGSTPGNYFAAFMTGNGSFGMLGSGQITSTASYAGVPADKLVAGDWHLVGADQSNSAGTMQRSVFGYFAQGGNRTLDIGPDLSAVSTSTVAASPLRLQATFAVQAEYGAAASVEFWQGSGSTSREFSVEMTSGYRGTATTWTLAIPDLSTAPGYNASWGLATGAAYSWWADARSIGFAAEAVPVDGTIVRMASRSSASAVTPRIVGGAPQARQPRRSWMDRR